MPENRPIFAGNLHNDHSITMLTVTHYYREPRKTGLSIEGIFRLVKMCLQGRVEINDFYCDPSLSRIQNTLRASKYASEINHITGDVNFLVLGMRRKKNILTIHDLGHYDTLKKRSALQYHIYKLFWFKYPLKYIDIVTVVSQFTKNKLVEYFNFPEERIRIIHDPVKPIFQFIKKYGLNAKPVVLMMGTGKHKNLDNLIEALRDTGFHLDIIGWPAPDELGKLINYGISYKVFNGLSDEEVYKRYLECDILFNASFYEGFGMPIIEAQAVGRAVVTSNISPMQEVAGGGALLVDPHQPPAIKEAIVELVSNKSLYDDLVARGRENSHKYQYQLIADQYYDVYMESANRKSGK